MEKVHIAKKLKKKEFKIPDSVTEETICTSCGKLAISGVCSSYGAAKIEYFSKDMIASGYCTCHSAPKPEPEPEPGTNKNDNKDSENSSSNQTVSPADSNAAQQEQAQTNSQPGSTPEDTANSGTPSGNETVTQNLGDIVR